LSAISAYILDMRQGDAMKAVLIALLMPVPGVAWAGCEEPATPDAWPVEICYSGKCETTSIDTYCKAPGARGIAFHNGWNVSWDVENGKYAGQDGAPRDLSRLSCRALFAVDDTSEVISPSCWFLGLDD